MVSFWVIVNRVIRESDILIMVLDSRFPNQTRNEEIERKVADSGKKLLHVFNKCDLVDKPRIEAHARKFRHSVFISSKKHFGGTILRTRIMELTGGKPVVVGVLGYPNVGKSSVINLLKGKGSAPVSSRSGFTKGFQKVKVSSKILLIDTPGVLPFKEADKVKQAIIGAVSFDKVKDPEEVVFAIMEEYPGMIESRYGLEPDPDPENLLESVARKLNRIKKGGEPDTEVAARLILREWQAGKVNYLNRTA